VKTHEAIIIHNRKVDVIEASKMACLETKKKNRLHESVYLKAVYHIHSPYGHIVVVELPNGDGGETEVGGPMEVHRGRTKR